MNKTAANMRALREECGFTQLDVAEAFEVTVLSVKRWEKGVHFIPDPVFEWLEARYEELNDFAAVSFERVERLAAEAEGREDVPNPRAVQLSYYRTQEELDEARMIAGLESEPVGYANAKTRAVGFDLEVSGYDVEYVYGMQRFAE